MKLEASLSTEGKGKGRGRGRGAGSSTFSVDVGWRHWRRRFPALLSSGDIRSPLLCFRGQSSLCSAAFFFSASFTYNVYVFNVCVSYFSIFRFPFVLLVPQVRIVTSVIFVITCKCPLPYSSNLFHCTRDLRQDCANKYALNLIESTRLLPALRWR